MRRLFDLTFLMVFSVPIIFLFIITLIFCLLFQGFPIFFSQNRGGFQKFIQQTAKKKISC